MGIKSEAIGEVFLLAWERGLRLNVDVALNLEDCYRNLSSDELLCVGWDQCEPPNNEDDINFLSQYIAFKKIYKTE